MRRALFALALVAAPLGAQTVDRGPSGPLRVQLDAMPLSGMVTMLMRDVMRVPYIISDEVLADKRMVSVNLVMPRSEIPVRVVRFLRSQGLHVAIDGGTVVVSRPGGSGGGAGGGLAPGAASGSPAYAGTWSGSATVPRADGGSIPSGSPLAPSSGGSVVSASSAGMPVQRAALVPASIMPMAVVRPASRSVGELSQILQSVMPELVIAARNQTQPQDSRLVDQLEPDALVFSGEAVALYRAVDLLRLVDRPRPVVDIRAVIVETRNTSSASSALNILASIGALRIDRAGSSALGTDSIGIVAGGIKAFLSATKGDGRFRIVAEPKISVASGSTATLQSGAQVPTLGAVTVPENGGPAVRSIDYRDTGLLLTVKPFVRASGIELEVTQERSSVARTSTGVDDSPTVNRSAAKSTVVVAPGETFAVAGLRDEDESHSRSGFFGGLLGGRERASSKGELVVLIEATTRDPGTETELSVQFLGLTSPDKKALDKGAAKVVYGDASMVTLHDKGVKQHGQ